MAGYGSDNFVDTPAWHHQQPLQFRNRFQQLIGFLESDARPARGGLKRLGSAVLDLAYLQRKELGLAQRFAHLQ